MKSISIAEAYQEIYDKAQALATQEIRAGEDSTVWRNSMWCKSKRVPTDCAELDRIAHRREYHIQMMIEMLSSQNTSLTT